MELEWTTYVQEGLVTSSENPFEIRLCRVDPTDPENEGQPLLRVQGEYDPLNDRGLIGWKVRKVEGSDLPISKSMQVWLRLNQSEWSRWTEQLDRWIVGALEDRRAYDSWERVGPGGPGIWLYVLFE